MNVQPIAGASERVNEVRALAARLVNEEILPHERLLWVTEPTPPYRDADVKEAAALRAHVRHRVRQAGLWAPHLPEEYGGAGLGFLELAHLHEVLAYAVGAASLFGIAAPNAGNEALLARYGTEEQKRRWLVPLAEGQLESGFSMTEPDQPGSDPRALQTTARRDGDEWVVNGHKWFTSNGTRADFFIVMCRTEDETSPANGRMTQIIVPREAPGVTVVRGIEVWGRQSDHCEVVYEDVRVPLANQLGETGSGHQAAQDRLGAGRVFHCMNSVGQMWRAFDLMVERAATRSVHGGPLEAKQLVQAFIADSFVDVQSARLLTLHCAERIDAGADARADISAIKVAVPAAYHRVVDRAIQVWGAAGISGDLPLAQMYLTARALRIADGPDEVHRILVAKQVLAQHHRGAGWDFAA